MIQKDHEYISGSTARKLEYDVYEQNKVLKAKKQYKNNRKAKLKVVFSVLVVLAAGLVIMYRFALITQMNYNISNSEKVYNEIKNENSLILMQVEKDTDLTSIKETAETRLGMQKPDKSQIIYIKVPKNDYTVVMNTQDEVEKQTGSKLSGFVNKVAGIINLIN